MVQTQWLPELYVAPLCSEGNYVQHPSKGLGMRVVFVLLSGLLLWSALSFWLCPVVTCVGCCAPVSEGNFSATVNNGPGRLTAVPCVV